MSKYPKIFLIVIGSVIVLWYVLRLTGMIRFYNIPVSSNSPTLNPGDKIISSNLVKPRRLDFICFNVEKPEGTEETRVYRLCGMEGDSVEIKNGSLHINGDNVDQHLMLTQEYKVSSENMAEIEEAGYLDEAGYVMTSPDSMQLSLPEKFVKEKGIKCRRVILGKSYKDEYIKSKYGANWNQDNFGPVVVPKGSFFLLGDNRHQCEDSRYLGFINQSAFLGTVLRRK
jgi:signal peptidase I